MRKLKKHAGAVWEVLSPDSADLEEVLSSRCVRLQDGNTFYEGDVENFIYCPVVKDTMRPYMNTAENKEDGSEYQVKGTFLMEFTDFCETFCYYNLPSQHQA